MGSKTHRLIDQAVIFLLIGALAIIFVLPFVWMVSSSLKGPQQLFRIPFVWIPDPVYWQNFAVALSQLPFLVYMRNTLVICFGTVVGSVISNALVAYGFSRIRWLGRDKVFGLVLATMMIPWAVALVPLFVTFKTLHWIDTYQPFIVPTFFGNPFYIFLLRQFFLTIPTELSEAARIDGANELQILFQIILPLTRPALTTVALFSFLSSWGDYFGPLIYLRTPDKFTLALGVSQLIAGSRGQDYGALMAASLLSFIPIIGLFVFMQRTFVEGIALSGIRG